MSNGPQRGWDKVPSDKQRYPRKKTKGALAQVEEEVEVKDDGAEGR